MKYIFLVILLGPAIFAQDTRHRAAKRITYISHEVLLLSEPNHQFADPIAKLLPGLKIEVLVYDSVKPWLFIRTPNGREGWIFKNRTAMVNRGTRPVVVARKRQGELASRDISSVEDVSIVEDSVGQEKGDSSPDFDSYEDESYSNSADDDIYYEQEIFEEVDYERVKRLRAKKKKHEFVDTSKWYKGNYFVSLSGEFANQTNIEATSGFGAQVSAGYYMWEKIAVGLALEWNTFNEGVEIGTANVERDATRMFVGALLKWRHERWSVDFALGLESLESQFTATTGGAKIPVPVQCGLTSGDDIFKTTSMGFSLEPSYQLLEGDALRVSAYSHLATGFHSGKNLHCGGSQTAPIMLGAGIRLDIDF